MNYLGIDLHKRSSTWILVNSERSVIHKQVLPVTKEALVYGITSLPVPINTIKATLEPVCGWRWVQQQLIDSGINTVLANPTKVRLIAASKHKTDTNDARMLAELLASGYLPEAYRAPEETEGLRNLVRERHYLVSVRTSFKNRLKGIVTARGVNDILEDCLTQKGRQYIESHNLLELRDLHELISELTTYIKRLDKQLAIALEHNQLAKLLRTVPVVGPVSVATLVAEVGDFSRFATAKKLTNYAGLVPGQRSSGERLRYGKITKVGSKYLRHTMVECAMRLRSCHDPRLFTWYEQVKTVSSPMKARIALARKLLSIMWYMAKNNTPYTPRNHEIG
ncbi:MAG TPA: IS110 family transposase [Candidatus Paceibacterota bacterium]|nr:IS110 family transposase [Candidatus Paceibacterota bacterium]HMO83111.1 IS110 family transposase [Candidatus Paceibacterota bacterium]